jgi:hypothetical protein
LVGKSTHLKSDKAIFDSGYSSTSVVIMACSVLFCTVVFAFIVVHIGHYPVAGCIVVLLLLRIMIDAKIERMFVLEDRLLIVTRRAVPGARKKEVVLFSDVESLHIPDDKGGIFLVRFKDGTGRILSPGIRKAQFQEAMAVIEMLYLMRKAPGGDIPEPSVEVFEAPVEGKVFEAGMR